MANPLCCPYCRTPLADPRPRAELIDKYLLCRHCNKAFKGAAALPANGPKKSKATKAKARPPADEDIGLDAVFDEPWPPGMEPRPRRGWFLPLLFALLLGALLAGQYAWFFERDRLLQDPRSRPLLEQACAWVARWTPCTLPVTRALERIKVTQRYVAKHETVDGAVLVHILFQNTADFPQPYPLLELSFHDNNEQTIGVRRFSPVDYLDSTERAQSLMPPGQEVHVKLEFRDLVPAMHTYGFTIDFYPMP